MSLAATPPLRRRSNERGPGSSGGLESSWSAGAGSVGVDSPLPPHPSFATMAVAVVAGSPDLLLRSRGATASEHLPLPSKVCVCVCPWDSSPRAFRSLGTHPGLRVGVWGDRELPARLPRL